MAAVEFPVEALGAGAWFWAPGRFRFPHGLPPASGLENPCLRTAPWQQSPKIGGLSQRSAVAVTLGIGSLPLPEVGTLLPD
jgi:hypothetical protein